MTYKTFTAMRLQLLQRDSKEDKWRVVEQRVFDFYTVVPMGEHWKKVITKEFIQPVIGWMKQYAQGYAKWLGKYK